MVCIYMHKYFTVVSLYMIELLVLKTNVSFEIKVHTNTCRLCAI